MLISIKSKLKAFCLAVGILANNYNAIALTEEAEPSQPPPELERLEYFEGTWRCQQPAAPETPIGVFMWTVQLDLNDFWYVGNAEEIEFPDEREPINSREFLGYDTVSQKLFRYVVVNNGNSLNFTALDWQEETLVWEGAVINQGNVQPLRQEIIQDGKDKFTSTYLVNNDTGEWQPTINETCERVE